MNFFIIRPIFATVIALLMLIAGGIAMFLLPIAQYPVLTPPQVQVSTEVTPCEEPDAGQQGKR